MRKRPARLRHHPSPVISSRALTLARRLGTLSCAPAQRGLNRCAAPVGLDFWLPTLQTRSEVVADHHSQQLAIEAENEGPIRLAQSN
jgi:hypothetical protein